MAQVELVSAPGVPEAIIDLRGLRDALERAGFSVAPHAEGERAASPENCIRVVACDLEQAEQILERYRQGAEPIVLVQAASHPRAGGREGRAHATVAGALVTFCVWGAAARDDLAARYPGARIFVTGLPADRPGLAAALPHASPPRVDHDATVGLVSGGLDDALDARLRTLGIRTVRLDPAHPVAKPGSRENRPAMIVAASAAEAHTWTVPAGIPLVVLDPPGERRRMPVIQHHLLASADDLGQAEELVVAALATGEFWGNSAGELLERHLAGSGGLDGVVAAVRSAAAGGPPIPPVQPPAPPLVVAGANFGRDVGLAIPVMTLASALAASGRGTVRYVDTRAFGTLAQYRKWTSPNETLVVNGLESLSSAPALRRLVTERLERGDSVFVYVHLTEAGLDRERKRRAGELEAALRVLRRCTVLCVSEYQASLFRGLGAADTVVVYNTSPSLAATVPRPAQTAPRADPGGPRIVMAGTLQERKGVDLFSRVADLAAERHPDWRFEWAGAARGPLPADLRRSERVTWHGRLDRDRLEALLGSSDVFFLSSRDDPMPLAAVEAIGLGLRVVSYRRVGIFEILDGLDGFASFAEYDPEHALAALEAALASTPDPAVWQSVRTRFTPESFTERFLAAVTAQDPAPSTGRATAAPPLRAAAPPPYPVPVGGLADEGLPVVWRAVLRRRARRHAGDRAAERRERLRSGLRRMLRSLARRLPRRAAQR
jgi:glycosyltransferase involved in cell wall biosynthesis